MKHNLDDLDLRPAFRDEPEQCHRALMDAVRSVKEEEKNVKHLNLRPLLVAAIGIVSMLSVAYAASELLGINSYFSRLWEIYPSQELQSAMKPDDFLTAEVGPLTFTVQERIADPYLALISTEFKVTQGTQAIVSLFPEEMIMPENLKEYIDGSIQGSEFARALGFETLTTQTTWLEAAQTLELPLYRIRVTIEPAQEHAYGSGRSDIIWNSDAVSGTFISHVVLKNVTPAASIQVTLFFEVAQFQPETGEITCTWSERIPYSLPVSKLIATGHYFPESPLVTDGLTLTHLNAELYKTGMYVYRYYQMPGDTPLLKDTSFSRLFDKTPLSSVSGEAFMPGISLHGNYDLGDWPTLTSTEMVNVTTLPEIIQVGGVNYALQTE